MANRTKLTLSARGKFLAALRAGNTVTHAAGQIGMRRQGLYEHKKVESGFSDDWDAALLEGIDVLEQEAKRRAVEGTLKPVFHQGVLVTGKDGEPLGIREYSDALLALLLKAKKPDTYRDNVAVDHKGRVDHKHEHSGRIDLRQATEDELAVFERVAARTNGHAK